jgi:hypothetical protein
MKAAEELRPAFEKRLRDLGYDPSTRWAMRWLLL